MQQSDTDQAPQDGRRVIRDINTRGWHAAQVAPAAGHHGWGFSVGFEQTFGHPEVTVFGLPEDVQDTLIETIGQRLRAGQRFADGHVDDQLAPPYRCMFRSVDAAWRSLVLPLAAWFYGDRPFAALQLFWPDRLQRFPWDADFDAELVTFQPLLFHGNAVSAWIHPGADGLAISPH